LKRQREFDESSTLIRIKGYYDLLNKYHDRVLRCVMHHVFHCFQPYKSRHIGKNFEKSMVPRPVTGSQPGTAENPAVSHPGFVPFVMSLKDSLNLEEYNAGLINPIGFLPNVVLASLIIASIDATTGAEAEVP